MKRYLTFKNFLWLIYIGVLIVITPHTQWMFSQFEPPETGGVVSWIAAIVFESAIFISTHFFVEHIKARKPVTFNFEKKRMEDQRFGRYFTWWPMFRYRWVNVYSAFVIVPILVSALANLAHAVQYGKTLRIVELWNIPFGFFTVAFGGILPLVNLLFAAVIAQAEDAAEAPNPELDKANATIADLRRQLKESEGRVKTTEAALSIAEAAKHDAETRFTALGDFVVKLFAEDKRQRILAIHQQWPRLPGSAIAVMAEAAPGYVSDVINGKA